MTNNSEAKSLMEGFLDFMKPNRFGTGWTLVNSSPDLAVFEKAKTRAKLSIKIQSDGTLYPTGDSEGISKFRQYLSKTNQKGNPLMKGGAARLLGTRMSKWGLVLGIILILVIIGAFSNSGSNTNTTSTSSVTSSGPTQVTTIGQEGYLRLPNITDPSQVILLAPTRDIYSEVVKSSLANDTMGLLELTQKGVFGVSNGTKVLVIDRAVGTTRVRIVQGVRPVDDDKVEQSGWVASEWVVNQ